MASRTRGRIIEAAIELYADYGYFGVTIRDLAHKAKTTEGTIYRVFKNRDNVFDEALKTVISRWFDPAQLVLMIFENQKKLDFGALIMAVIRRWYAGMPEQSARFLMQAYWSKKSQWRATALAPIEKLIQLLTTSLEREKVQPSGANVAGAARGLILSLFQFKLTSAERPAKQETEVVNGVIEHWLRGFALGSSS